MRPDTCTCGHWHWPISDSAEHASVAAAMTFSSAGMIEPIIATPPIALPSHQWLAFHEASHAAAGIVAGAKIGFATVEGAQPAVGYLRSADEDRWQAITALAGPAGEMLEHRHEHRLDDFGWHRHLNAVRSGAPPRCDRCKAASAANGAMCDATPTAVMAWLRRREEETVRVLRMRPVWAAVRRLAAELREHGTLPGSRVEEIVSVCVPMALRSEIKKEIENAG